MEKFYNNLKKNFFIIAGPCVIEDIDTCFKVAETVKNICNKLNINYIFKSSFDKANRSSVNSFRGPGIVNGLEILNKIKNTFQLPVTTDIHETWQVNEVKNIVDIIQIPAFLSRQTDLLLASGKSGKIVNVKKGQFLSGYDAKNIVKKLQFTGNNKIILTERGNTFGYNNLVVDMRNIPIMKSFADIVVFDATHSVQLPGGADNCSSGNREFVYPLAKAAVAAGANGVFLEVHPTPERALCDGPNSIKLDNIENIIKKLYEIYKLVNYGENYES
jgi:2-dehydro-3-deoxyphosphooctonate aldolase (KDO 8-P synthase)